MISLNDACKNAIEFADYKDKKTINWVAETEKRFLVAIKSKDEEYYSPIGVMKENGKTTVFFPPDDYDDYKTMRKLDIPAQYRGYNT